MPQVSPMPHPQTFYKFAPAGTVLLVLQHSRLRWSSPSIFDDPAEFKRLPRFEPTISEASTIFSEVLVKAAQGKIPIREADLTPTSRMLLTMTRLLINSGTDPATLAAKLGETAGSDEKMEAALGDFFNERYISTARVLCVAPAYDNEKLWISYADQFKGCVLGFRHIPDLDTPLLAARPIVYSEHPPMIGSGVDFLLYAGTQELRRATIDAVCFTKKHHWSYQQEWRVITWRDSEGDALYGDYKFYPDELESVTVGSAASQNTLQSVVQLLRSRYRNCRLYKLIHESGQIRRVEVSLHSDAA